MLRTFLVGALAAFGAARLKKAYDEGKLDTLKDRVKDGSDRLRKRLSEGEDALIPARRPLPTPPHASDHARRSPSDEVSSPARPHPWPVDPRAMPEES